LIQYLDDDIQAISLQCAACRATAATPEQEAYHPNALRQQVHNVCGEVVI